MRPRNLFWRAIVRCCLRIRSRRSRPRCSRFRRYRAFVFQIIVGVSARPTHRKKLIESNFFITPALVVTADPLHSTDATARAARWLSAECSRAHTAACMLSAQTLHECTPESLLYTPHSPMYRMPLLSRHTRSAAAAIAAAATDSPASLSSI